MMNSRLFALISALASALMIASCAGSRFARDGERLYAGAAVSAVSSEKPIDKKLVEKTAREALRQKPNRSYLGLYPKLWFYSLAPDSVHKGFRAWLKKKAGEPPVYIKNVNPEATAKLIDAKLFNIGIFNGSTTFALTGNKNTAKVHYYCAVHPPFRVANVTFMQGEDSLSKLIASLVPSSLIRTGDAYDLSKLKFERERIDSVLKENGYFYFNPDYLVFTADTSRAPRTVNLSLSLKNDVPTEAKIPYLIRTITIDPSYTLERDSLQSSLDTATIDSVVFIGTSTIRPRVLLRSCALRRNRLYSRRQHNRTLNRIMNMGNFKYAAIKFSGTDSAGSGFLDVKILMTPLQKRSLRSELALVSKSNDFIGPELNLNYSDRNVLGGAEILNLTMSGSLEAQLVNQYKNLYSYELSPQLDFNVPRFMIPFIALNPRGAFVPKTKFSFGYSYIKRINYFDSKSFLMTYGFKWRASRRTGHELNPVTINYVTIYNKSQAFSDSLAANPYLQKSYENQFIAGSFYSYTFNEQAVPKQKNQFFFNGTAELSGNAFSIAHRLFTGRIASADKPLSVAGSVYSQFARLTLDARNVTNLSSSQKLVVRLYAGAGKAYGNSATLPYAKQFFCGGPSSIRAFPINSVGPGTSDSQESVTFLEPGGDCKMEANAEYRFPIIGFLKGAAFVDAGNTWLLGRDTSLIHSQFDVSHFYKELALGTGAGLRLDVSFFILRLDLGIPLRKPTPDESKRWIINEINQGVQNWQKKNLVWNIAIGYPF
jgi:outer membrane protein insertion porin family